MLEKDTGSFQPILIDGKEGILAGAALNFRRRGRGAGTTTLTVAPRASFRFGFFIATPLLGASGGVILLRLSLG